jgi:hypothetical protein
MWRGEATLRAIWVRVRMLPPDSAVKRAVDPHGWRLEHYMLADIFDVLAGANWQRAGDGKAKRPGPYPRPEAIERAEHQRDRVAEMARQFRATTKQE